MALTAQQQAAIRRARGLPPTQMDEEDEEQSGLTEGQLSAIRRVRQGQTQQDNTESRGVARGVSDFVVGTVGAVPKAAGGIVSLGSYVPGVNLIADPVAEALMDAGTWVDDTFLSAYQQNINQEFAQAMADSARQLGEDASISDHIENIAAQGGGAASFIYDNPSQAAMLAGQAIPYIFGGGLITKGIKGAAAATGATKVANMSAATGAAVGEGLMAAGAAEEQIVRGLREQGITGYTTDRLAGIPAGVVTGLVGRAGGRFAGGSDVDTIVTSRIADGSTDLLTSGVSGNMATRAIKGGLIEGAEELVQGGQEQAFVNLGTGDPISQDVGASAVAGAFAGTAIGAPVGALSGRRQQDASQQAVNDIEEQNQMELEERALADQQYQEEQQREVVREELRDKHAPAFQTQKEFTQARDEARVAQVQDPNSELGQLFKTWRIQNRRYGDMSDSAVKAFLGESTPADDKATAEQEYLAALDQFAEQQEAAQRDQMEFDFDGTQVQQGEQQLELPLPEPKQPTPVGEATEASVEPAQKPKTKKEKVDFFAREQLGENYQEQYPDLSQMLEDPKTIKSRGKGPSSKFEKQVLRYRQEIDAANQMQENAAQQPETANPEMERVRGALTELSGTLRGNQKKVLDTFTNALYNYEADKFIQQGGKINFKDLAAEAGVVSRTEGSERQSAQAAFKQVAPKLAKALGVKPENVIEIIQAVGTRPQQDVSVEQSGEAETVSAPDTEAPQAVQVLPDQDESMDATEALDKQELGVAGGFNTKASVGQGSYEGVSREDKAFAKQRSEEVDPVFEARVAEKKQAEVEALDNGRALLQQAWNQHAPEGVSFDTLAQEDQIDFMRSMMEYLMRKSETQPNEDGETRQQTLARDIDGIMTRTKEAANAAEQTAQNDTGARTETNEPVQEASDAPAANDAEGGGTVEQQGTTDTGTVVQQQKAPVVEVKKSKKRKPRFGLPPKGEFDTASREEIDSLVKRLTGNSKNWRIHTFANMNEAIAAVEKGTVPDTDTALVRKVNPYGWVISDENGVSHAHFILDQIEAGTAKSKFMHEVGGHIGMDGLLSQEEQRSISKQIFDWADKNDGSEESRLSLQAISRVGVAMDAGGVSDGAFMSEIIAYFLEEATQSGIDPTVDAPAANLFNKIVEFVRNALDKINLVPQNLTPQDIVDVAWGAARISMEIETQVTDDNGNAYPTKFGVTRDYASRIAGSTGEQIVDNAAHLARSGLDGLKFLPQYVREVAGDLPKAAEWYDALKRMQKTRQDIIRSVEGIAVRASKLEPQRLTAVNDYIGKSTFFQQWGYQPSYKSQPVKINPIMKQAFNRLSDDEKQIVIDVFEHGNKMLQRRREIAKKLGVSDKFFSTAELDGPYAPLKRFGNHVGELKSQRLLDAEARADRENSKAARDAVEKLKSDPDHYHIEFFDTPGAAKQFVQKNEGKYAYAVAQPKIQESDATTNPDYQALQKVLAGLNAVTLDQQDRAAVEDMVKDLYFKSLDESNARLSGLKRKNRAGYEKDMIRSFLSHAQSEANLISQMEEGANVNSALVELREQAKAAKKLDVYNQLSFHYRNTVDPRRGVLADLQDQVTSLNSAFMLTTNVAYHVTNATQPAMVTVPKVAGDVGDYTGTWAALTRGYKMAPDIITASDFASLKPKVEIDVNKAPEKYRQLLEELQLRQLLDVGMEEDLTNFKRFDTGFVTLNKGVDATAQAMHDLYQVARLVESYNRVSAAVAAFDMAQKNQGKIKRMYNMTPQEYAIAVVEDTQGNFSAMDAPALIKSLPKVTTQYRKYQIMMGWLYGNAVNQVFGKGKTMEQRVAGARAIGYSLAHVGLVSGAVGLPGASLALWAYGLMSGDEPDDIERSLRATYGDDIGGTLARGFGHHIGVDLSTKLSQGTIYSLFPYMNEDANIYEQVGTVVLGPAGSTINNFQRGITKMSEGDVFKGIEVMMPRGIRNVMESYRVTMDEGFSLNNGDIIQDATDFDMLDTISTALGFSSERIRELKWQRGQQYELKKYFGDATADLRKRYIAAHKEGDKAEKAKIKKEWRELQDRKDRVRQFFGDDRSALRRQPIADLIAAPREQRRRELKSRRQFATD